MHRFIPGLTKLPEKRKITQTEKRQRDCTIVANVIGGRPISRNGRRSMHGLLTDENNAMFCSSTSCCRGGQDTGTIGILGNNAFAPMKSGLVKSLAD